MTLTIRNLTAILFTLPALCAQAAGRSAPETIRKLVAKGDGVGGPGEI